MLWRPSMQVNRVQVKGLRVTADLCQCQDNLNYVYDRECRINNCNDLVSKIVSILRSIVKDVINPLAICVCRDDISQGGSSICYCQSSPQQSTFDLFIKACYGSRKVCLCIECKCNANALDVSKLTDKLQILLTRCNILCGLCNCNTLGKIIVLLPARNAIKARHELRRKYRNVADKIVIVESCSR